MQTSAHRSLVSQKAATIVLIDSGVGGLSMLPELRTHLPEASLIYYADHEHFPYGPKSEDALNTIVLGVVTEIVSVVQPDILVVACNTASTVVLPSLRATFPFPVVGVVPAVKPAAALSKSGTIGLLATKGTVTRAYTDKLIDQFASSVRVIRVASSRLVEIAEAKIQGGHVNLRDVEEELAPFFGAHIHPAVDTIVLGCTHFPLLRQELEAVVPWRLNWLDSAEAVARRVVDLLDRTSTDQRQVQHMRAGAGEAVGRYLVKSSRPPLSPAFISFLQGMGLSVNVIR